MGSNNIRDVCIPTETDQCVAHSFCRQHLVRSHLYLKAHNFAHLAVVLPYAQKVSQCQCCALALLAYFGLNHRFIVLIRPVSASAYNCMHSGPPT